MSRITIRELKNNLSSLIEDTNQLTEIVNTLKEYGFSEFDTLYVDNNKFLLKNWKLLKEDQIKSNLAYLKGKKNTMRNIISYLSSKKTDAESLLNKIKIYRSLGEQLEESKLSQDYIRVINHYSTQLTSNQISELAYLVALMHKNKISKATLEKMLEIARNPNAISGIKMAVDSMKVVRLNDKRLKALFKNSNESFSEREKMEAISKAIESMQKNKIPLSDDQENLATLMQKSTSKIKAITAFMGAMKKVTPQRFKVLLEESENGAPLKDKVEFSDDQVNAISKSIQLLEKQGIPLSDKNNNLSRLMKLNEQQAKNIHSLISKMAPLMQSRFNLLINNTDKLVDKEKIKALEDSIDKMQKKGLPLSDKNQNLAKLIEMESGLIKKANTLLDKMIPLTQQRFTTVINHVGKILDLSKEMGDLVSIIETMQAHDIPLSDEKKNLQKLMALNSENLHTIKTLIDKISEGRGRLNQARFSVILDNVSNLEESEKLSSVCYLVGRMQENGIPLSDGNLAKLMNEQNEVLKNVNQVLTTMEKTGLNRERFKVIMDNLNNLTDAKTQKICEVIHLMQKSGIPLRGSKGNLDKLMKEPKEVLENVISILQEMEKKNLNSTRFHVLIENLNQLDDEDKAKEVCQFIKWLQNKDIPISDSKNNLHQILQMSPEEIKKINEIFKVLANRNCPVDDYKAVAENLDGLKDADKCSHIMDIITLMKNHEISLTEGTLNKLIHGEEDNITELLKLNNDNLKNLKENLQGKLSQKNSTDKTKVFKQALNGLKEESKRGEQKFDEPSRRV